MTDHRTPPTSSSRPSPPPPAGDYATLDVATIGLEPDQEIRARALATAVEHLGMTGDLYHTRHQKPSLVLDLADVYAAYIRDGSTR